MGLDLCTIPFKAIHRRPDLVHHYAKALQAVTTATGRP
jgi:hypothetical protein